MDCIRLSLNDLFPQLIFRQIQNRNILICGMRVVTRSAVRCNSKPRRDQGRLVIIRLLASGGFRSPDPCRSLSMSVRTSSYFDSYKYSTKVQRDSGNSSRIQKPTSTTPESPCFSSVDFYSNLPNSQTFISSDSSCSTQSKNL